MSGIHQKARRNHRRAFWLTGPRCARLSSARGLAAERQARIAQLTIVISLLIPGLNGLHAVDWPRSIL